MSTLEPNKNEWFPPAGIKVFFVAAIVYARSIDFKKDKPVKGSHSHRTQMAKAEEGYLLIDQEWYVKTQS
jgi:hypothetical protein